MKVGGRKAARISEGEYEVEIDYPNLYGQDRYGAKPNWDAVEKDIASRIVVE